MEKIKQLSFMFGDEEPDEDDEFDAESLDDKLFEQTPQKAVLESEMDLVSPRSHSIMEN